MFFEGDIIEASELCGILRSLGYDADVYEVSEEEMDDLQLGNFSKKF